MTQTRPKPVFLLAGARSGNRLSRHFRPLRQLLVLNGPRNLLITCYLASCRFWYAICPWMKVQSHDGRA
jgi:hypothetical protein